MKNKSLPIFSLFRWSSTFCQKLTTIWDRHSFYWVYWVKRWKLKAIKKISQNHKVEQETQGTRSAVVPKQWMVQQRIESQKCKYYTTRRKQWIFPWIQSSGWTQRKHTSFCSILYKEFKKSEIITLNFWLLQLQVSESEQIRVFLNYCKGFYPISMRHFFVKGLAFIFKYSRWWFVTLGFSNIFMKCFQDDDFLRLDIVQKKIFITITMSDLLHLITPPSVARHVCLTKYGGPNIILYPGYPGKEVV